jgi:hypothetical protein
MPLLHVAAYRHRHILELGTMQALHGCIEAIKIAV